MVTTRNSIDDVVAAAGRLFSQRGYHGTSMRDLGRELGLLGSSLYSHISSKQDLLVAVVEEGARLFERSASRATGGSGDAEERLRALISGHVDVVLDNRDVVRTFLNEARMLDAAHRRKVLEARDRYESVFRSVIGAGVRTGEFAETVDPKLASIFALSVLNAIERWYDPDGEIDRDALVAALGDMVVAALR